MTTNDDFSDHDHTADTASTPNAADLNAALPQLMSSSTTAFDAFDDLDINQTNFSELDEEEQDIAHIILSDPSLLGLDLLIGAGPPKSRAGESTSGATGNESSRQHGFRAPSPMVTASSTPFMDTSGDTYSNNQSSHLKQQSSTPAAQGATDDRPIRNLGFPRMAPSNGTNAQLVNGVRQRPPPDILSRSRADNTGGWSADSDGAPGGTRVGEGPRVESPPKPFVR
ncbi:hypothetical protein QFC19_004448 [Naganishia cerealis]|uniref:Uncharacterized protein n=1 Tax=Naganishia cerealis TaxID=610337 RepID=A0ACC2VWW2_9TREE|nr:hypothetical protein QFC19_004448 [Naganishia cerealis]